MVEKEITFGIISQTWGRGNKAVERKLITRKTHITISKVTWRYYIIMIIQLYMYTNVNVCRSYIWVHIDMYKSNSKHNFQYFIFQDISQAQFTQGYKMWWASSRTDLLFSVPERNEQLDFKIQKFTQLCVKSLKCVWRWFNNIIICMPCHCIPAYKIHPFKQVGWFLVSLYQSSSSTIMK